MDTHEGMRSIHEQLRAALAASGLTHQELVELAELDFDRTNLSRQLAGQTAMKTRDAEKIARALKVPVLEVSDAEAA